MRRKRKSMLMKMKGKTMKMRQRKNGYEDIKDGDNINDGEREKCKRKKGRK